MSNTKYIVVCRGDREEDGSKGEYELATHRYWWVKAEAQKYADTCSPSREAFVVTCPGGLDMYELRQ